MVIVEAIRTDVYSGSYELEYARHSQYACSNCGKNYEFVVHAAEGEYQALADPIPPHFDLLSDRVDADHGEGHDALTFHTDGVRVWNPLKPVRPAQLAWSDGR